MANLKTQFSELTKNTPKHVQWLLLAAAFIVVLILLTLLLRGDKTQPVTESNETIQAALNIDPDSLDWATTKIGETKNQKFVISSNVPVKIDAVRLSKDVSGLSKPKTTCTNIGQINDKISCTISMDFTPSTEMDINAVSLFIDWRGAGQPEKMNRTEKIAIAIGAMQKETLKQELVLEKKTQMKQEIESIAQADPFHSEKKEQEIVKPKQDTRPEQPAPKQKNDDIKTGAESCSDFAFPGYNITGQQVGWIKPEKGNYKFHPFSDTNCDSPTGIYNPDNGIITDINDTSKKIGTDAEHIGYGTILNNVIPELSNPVNSRTVNKARQLTTAELELKPSGKSARVFTAPPADTKMLPSSFGSEATVSSRPYDRTFVLRQYKPIPATIVSEIRAVAGETRLPVTATVDRNVYSDNGRTIIIPAGTMMLGSVSDKDMPGPYKTIGRVGIEWYRFVRPDGVEFNFVGNKPFSADAQGRTGVPGRGSTDYVEQFVMPMLTAVVPAAVNMIAPISDKFVNQIDLDNNTVTQTGQVRSSELAKNEIITAWNKVAQKLLVDMIDNTVPPFSIAAGTRITVFSPNDLIVTCGQDSGKKCSISPYDESYAPTGNANTFTVGVSEPETLVGQVRSFNLDQYCDGKGGVSASASTIQSAGFDYRTVAFYCQSNQYKAINNAKQEAVYKNQQTTSLTNSEGQKMQQGTKDYNEQVLGLKYSEDGTIQNPFEKAPVEKKAVLTCEDGTVPDANGCCTGETYTDMGEQGFNCCPGSGGDCFPPIK
ncbi:MAG: TrbI/VirB10 family protein [Alphaproteobacteria bacterium]|nr:TrbI/VirB10 family protein [Alphaproteobacteria bacterium]MBN2675487.1 TrbI/VirB10 family protein [Alphaproteobacteria bacterium]